MRWLTGLVVAVFVLWGGYWVVGSTAMERAATRWFADAPARGLVAENTGLAVHGFPSRFDLTVEGVRIGDPARGIEWQAPFAQVLMLSYQPWHMILALPDEQVLTLPQGRFGIRSDRMRGSLVVVPGPALALDRMRGEGMAVHVALPDGQTLQADTVNVATERDPAQDNAHRIGVEVANLLLPAGVAARTGLPAAVSDLHLDAVARFTAPIDRHLRETRPEIAALAVRDARLVWGEVTVAASGDLVADASGFAEGRLVVRVRNWRTALTAAQTAGLIPENLARTLERGLQVMAVTGGNPDELSVPLDFAQGAARLGPIPLGAAPRLR
ncbi:MAG: DUF2125 domain-containing protein [Paracoccaceae bacterium]